MKRKIFKFKNLENNDIIVITSKENSIDFAKECTHVVAYFNDFTKPEYYLYAELYIQSNNQPQTTVFELPVKGKNAAFVIEAITDYDIDKIIITKKFN